MIVDIVFDTFKVLASLIVFGILSYKLVVLHDKFTWVERLGMGLIAAGTVMVIGPITFKPSPFDDWAFTLMLIGQATYFVGRMTRHKLNNAHARKDALHWRQER